MNTDITASAKPEYPVLDRNPPFTKVVGNFSSFDYLRFTTITGISVIVGYLSGIKPGIRGLSMVTGRLIALTARFIYACQNSAGRLMGFFPNDGEVAQYKKMKKLNHLGGNLSNFISLICLNNVGSLATPVQRVSLICLNKILRVDPKNGELCCISNLVCMMFHGFHLT